MNEPESKPSLRRGLATPGPLDLGPYWEAMKGKTCSTLEEIRWACNNAGRPLPTIDPHEPPSWWAFQLVKLSATPGGMEFLAKEAWAKTIPNQKQLEQAERMKDNGRVLKILDTFQEGFEREQAARAQGAA